MTQINYEEEHRKLWYWLADHPEAGKIDYFKNWEAANWPYNLCFACEAALDCMRCPLGGRSIVGCTAGLYTDWLTEMFPETRRKLARKIANLPWKEKEND